ncbi:cytochrome c oxidase assembly protein [Methylocystis rosea]|nr:cytochrome c oxidase assembly protein [Methylocystis rosea]
MATHIILMSALAPFLAVLSMRFASAPFFATGRALAIVTAAQLALLYAWHAPGASAYVERHPTAHLLMHASLLTAALLFWLAILGDTGFARWRGVAALAITGKLACLLGVLLVFAPRVLDTSAASWGATTETMLADQRLAGLLMLAACPASYVLSGIFIASRWLLDMEANRSRARTYRPDGA